LIKAVIFDLDGTIADSEHIMGELYGRLFEEFGFPRPGMEEILKVIAHGGKRIVLELLPPDRKDDVELRERMSVRCGEISHDLLPKIRPMEGAAELLAELKHRGIRVAVATNRGSTTGELLELLGFSGHVDVTVTAKQVKNMKPHPEPLLLALKQLGTRPEEALFVGDNEVDLEAGNAAGIKTVLLTKRRVPGLRIAKLHELVPLLGD